ncbi:hypothetical protein WJ96_04260 [Burkholderia ubonensis]|uniref:Uncharacterized protein n=1 Tax=Burkholderia ubonensis TaxID=101571 RepID=A0AAW3MV13_9BURK|nr:hypothetical protein [Burkholderia ubonensis]KVP97788.1 hypothetical protein WJ96_04260 [Burkholderia ubonensis]
MTTKLYHKDVYAPDVIFRSPGVVRLRYSRHAQYAACDDRYGDLSRYLTPYMDFDEAEIVEVELDVEGQISKRVARFQVDEDLVLVVVAQTDGFVRTVWGNLISDRHSTLDRRKYVQPPRRVLVCA